LKTYPDGLFHLALGIGLYLVRRHNKRVGRGRRDFKVWDVLLIFFILIQVFIIAMPWWPPKGGPYAGEVSFWYATYCVVGIAMCVAPSSARIRSLTDELFSMITCYLYYVVWIYLIPKWKGYAIRTEVLEVDQNGANTHRLVKVPLAEVDRWDSEHDDAGNLRQRHVGSPVQESVTTEEKV
jgi:hypothetical protein